jgi:hypothetical protein
MKLLRNIASHTFAVFSSLILLALSAQAVTPRFACVPNSKDSTLSIYTVDVNSGQLRHDGWVLCEDQPALSDDHREASHGSTAIAGSPFAPRTAPGSSTDRDPYRRAATADE